MASRRILSGIQPTGIPHLGNFIGAIRQWTRLQADAKAANDAIFLMIADLHSLTVPRPGEDLPTTIRRSAASLIACGIDPEETVLFQQSRVPQHAELAWILGCVTPKSWLDRMTQFKDKSKKQKNQACVGLHSYPVLQAADILVYRATHVPVGDDQRQHLELTRNIVTSFNQRFGVDESDPVFAFPDTTRVAGGGARVLSLRDGTSKMSKSDASRAGRIDLTDSPEEIAAKVRRAKTDSDGVWEYDPEARPERSNLLSIFSELSGQSVDSLVAEYRDKDAVSFKSDLTEVVVNVVEPIRQELLRLEKEPAELDALLQRGDERAEEEAEATMRRVRITVGLDR